MHKWRIPTIIFFVILTAVILTTNWLNLPSKLPSNTAEVDACTRYGIVFDRSSISRIFQDPEAVLKDPSLFWTEDLAYQLVGLAPQYTGVSLPPDGWTENIEKVLSLSDQERESEESFARSLEINAHADTFCQNALPVIFSLLPDEAKLSTTVYLSVFTDPPGFAFRSSVVMNTDDPSYLGKTSKFFNLLGHEIFHVGYFDFQQHQTEVWSDFYPTKVALTTLQNDGLAVYTQYLLSSLYPAPAEIELLLLENKLAVRFFIQQVNDLLQQTEVLSEAEIMHQTFTGMNQRALYVVGAHMARTIDEGLGRDILVETVSRGPGSFIATYNTVAEDGMGVFEIPEPEELSAIQVLREAAIQGDLEVLADAIYLIRTEGIENPGGETFEHLASTGLLLLKMEQSSSAVDVFQIMVSLFPDHPYSYLYLGDAYTQNGEMDKAQEAYSRAVELDPRVAPAATQ